jgi:hypothetical protein
LGFVVSEIEPLKVMALPRPAARATSAPGMMNMSVPALSPAAPPFRLLPPMAPLPLK